MAPTQGPEANSSSYVGDDVNVSPCKLSTSKKSKEMALKVATIYSYVTMLHTSLLKVSVHIHIDAHTHTIALTFDTLLMSDMCHKYTHLYVCICGYVATHSIVCTYAAI